MLPPIWIVAKVRPPTNQIQIREKSHKSQGTNTAGPQAERGLRKACQRINLIFVGVHA